MGVRSCVACTRPAGAGYVLCESCGDRLADNLASVADLLADLDIALARLDVMAVAAGRGGEVGLPYATVASASRVALASTLIYWAQQLANTRATLWDIPNTLPEVADWLRYRIDWIRMLDTADQAYSQLDQVISRARSTVDRPASRTRFSVGACPELVDEHYCPGEIWATIPTRIGVDTAYLRCANPDCIRHITPWAPESWRRAGIRILRRKEALAHRHGHTGRGLPALGCSNALSV